MYTIGQVAEMFGLPVSTLRYYDKQGLFGPGAGVRHSPIRRYGTPGASGHRMLKKAGMEIKGHPGVHGMVRRRPIDDIL